MENFGARLREERKRLGLSQAEMAAVGDLKANALADYEKGARAPGADYLLKLLAAGVDVAYLFYGRRFADTASDQVREILNILTQLPPAQAAMAFTIVNMFRMHTAAAAATSDDGELIWRAARLFANFLGMDERDRAMVELTASFGGDQPKPE